MWSDRVSKPGPLALKLNALLTEENISVGT